MKEDDFKKKYNFDDTVNFSKSCGTCSNCFRNLNNTKYICNHAVLEKSFEILRQNFSVCEQRGDL